MLNSKSNPVARGVLSLAEVVRERLSEIEEQLEGEQEGEIIIAR
jgi:hypothetical protein